MQKQKKTTPNTKTQKVLEDLSGYQNTWPERFLPEQLLTFCILNQAKQIKTTLNTKTQKVLKDLSGWGITLKT